MSWENILKKTEKPTKVVEFGGGRMPSYMDSYTSNTHYSENHFDVCNKVTGKNRQFETMEDEYDEFGEDDYRPAPKRYELDNCNCRAIAKDWIGEIEFIKEWIFDQGVGTVYGEESSVHANDGQTDWNKLIEEKGD